MYEKVIELLTAAGGKTTNKALLAELGWSKDEYLAIREALVKDGVVKLARGRGGSVFLIKKEEVDVRS